MTKTELVSLMAEKSGLTKKDSESALNSFIDATIETLKKGDKIALVGFGTFEVRKRAARKGKNPQTGKEIDIPASNIIGFKVGKTLKDAVN